jgi:hypothetical protein
VGRAWVSPAGHLDWRPKARPLPDERPPASEAALAVGTTLGTIRHEADPDAVSEYLTAINDEPARWLAMGAVHPGWLLLDANDVLSQTVKLGPWIHTGSVVRTLQRVPFGADLETRAEVLGEHEKAGHRWVVMDVLTLANGQAAMRTRHTAIWQLRPA